MALQAIALTGDLDDLSAWCKKRSRIAVAAGTSLISLPQSSRAGSRRRADRGRSDRSAQRQESECSRRVGPEHACCIVLPSHDALQDMTTYPYSSQIIFRWSVIFAFRSTPL